MSNIAGISKIYLSQLFKKEIGDNFVDYLTKVRIDKAKELLLSTRMKMEEVSVKVGFVNAKYFSVVFKKLTGYTPLEYRLSKNKSDQI